MIKKFCVVVLAFMFICAGVYAADINATDGSMAAITPDELAAALAKLQAETAAARAEIITVRMDDETRQLFARLEDKIMLLEQKLIVIEDRFMLLKNDLSDKIESTAASSASLISSDNSKQIAELNKETKQYVRDMTNPIRINLPNFALWLMVTALFMLTAGLRIKKAVKDANREIKNLGVDSSARQQKK